MKLFVLILSLGLFFGSLMAEMDRELRKGIERFDSELSEILPDNEPGASVAITLGGKIIYENYFGRADLEKGEKLTADHLMGIASMSKQFTGMAVLFLVEEGKLSLDDPITKYYPDLPIGNRVIRIHQLLSHLSGLPELTQNDVFMRNIQKAHTVQEIIEIGLKGPFRSEPGEKYLYCNTGYILVTALIEKLSGMDYAAFLKKKIFDPLQMMRTYSCSYSVDASDAVLRYERVDDGFKRAEVMHFSNLIGGGGIISNVMDMAKWNMALLMGSHLPKNHRLIWETKRLDSGEAIDYGLGLGISDFEGHTFYYHPGMGSGMNSVNMLFPEHDLSVTVIRNVSKPRQKSTDIAFLAAKYLLPAKSLQKIQD